VKESQYQQELCKKLKEMFPGCVIHHRDSRDVQGTPDLTVFWGDAWFMLEVKSSANAPHRPNQDYYVEQFAAMSFAAFIYPENEEQVLNELQRSLGSTRQARVS
jgi:hypothetical protein